MFQVQLDTIPLHAASSAIQAQLNSVPLHVVCSGIHSSGSSSLTSFLHLVNAYTQARRYS
jgi:hypothetical protein